MSNKRVLRNLRGFRLANFQSFNENGASVIDPSRFNIFVGPNNVGKSKLVRAFKRLETGDTGKLLASDGKIFKLYIYEALDSSSIEAYWRLNIGLIPSLDKFSQYFEKVLREYEMTPGQDAPNAKYIGLCDLNEKKIIPPEKLNETDLRYHNKRASPKKFGAYPLSKGQFFYIGAERDVLPEAASNSTKLIDPNGRGTTALIRKFLLSEKENTDLVRLHMLTELNEILSPDYSFTDIRCQELETGHWEIFLRTEKYGDIALSQSGSGLKTVLQLLANTQLVVSSGSKTIDSGLFLFEELENSLHPRMQRNIYSYIKSKFAGDSVCVLSTHSPVAIDYFQASEDVSIYEVFQNNQVSNCRRIEAFDDKLGVLDALGVKASDALQSNFVVWVEGPTDRIYLKKFIEIYGGSNIIEGKHFSILFYGGRMLSHLTISEDDSMTQFIRLLKINPNCAVIIDSDRDKKRRRINATKTRIRSEASKCSRLCWVTQGREMENYISAAFWSKRFAAPETEVGPYTKVFDYLKGEDKRIASRKLQTKMELATFAAANITWRDTQLDLEMKVKDLCRRIRDANS